MNTEPPYAGLKWAHYLRVMLLVPLDQGTQGNKGLKGISLPISMGIVEDLCVDRSGAPALKNPREMGGGGDSDVIFQFKGIPNKFYAIFL